MEGLLQSFADLAGSPVRKAEPLSGGRNARVWRLDLENGETLVGKCYPADPRRDRLAAEVLALEFLADSGIGRAPRLVAKNPEQRCLLMEYVRGRRLTAKDLGPAQMRTVMQAMADFVGDLRRAWLQGGTPAFPEASEACFSGAAYEQAVRDRLDRLRRAAALHDDPDLDGFLAEYAPEVDRRTRELRRALGPDFNRELTRQERTASPSDFGPHNALLTEKGLVFLDFEYFGQDDPAKLAADTLLHPGAKWQESGADLSGLRTLLARALGGDELGGEEIGRRTGLVLPLTGLKWCLILLNEFLGPGLARRTFAARGDIDPGEARARQLAKAKRMLDRVRSMEPEGALP